MQNVPVPPHLYELLAAIAEALDVPLADRPEDDDTEAKLMRKRASEARIIASSVLSSPSVEDVVRSAAQLRTWTAEAPVTYTSWQQRTTAEAAEEQPAAEDGTPDAAETPRRSVERSEDRCARCRWTFDPHDKRHDGHARHGDGPFCRRCIDRCHESTDAFHACPVCDPS